MLKSMAPWLLLGSALLAGIGLGLQRPGNSAPTHRPEWQLADQQGALRSASEFDGRWVLVNFWATWCTPCLAEVPLLIETQGRYDPAQLQLLGPAYDRLEPAQAYAERVGINYPVLFGEMAIASWMQALGEDRGALPFSVLIDPAGRIRERHWGQLSEAQLAQWLEDIPERTTEEQVSRTSPK